MGAAPSISETLTRRRLDRGSGSGSGGGEGIENRVSEVASQAIVVAESWSGSRGRIRCFVCVGVGHWSRPSAANLDDP